MTKTIAVIAAVLAFALPLSAPAPASAQVSVQAPSSALLPGLTPQNYKSELAGDKPAFIIISDDNCDACPNLAKLAADYPEVKFYHGNASEFGAAAEILPVFFVNVPSAGVTFEMYRFASDDLRSFIAQRVKFALRQTAVGLKVRAVQDQIKKTSQSFDDELKTLSDEYETLWKPYAERIAIETAKANAIAESFDDQVYDLDMRVFNARNPVRLELIKARREAEAAVKANPPGSEVTKTLLARTRQLELQLDSISLKFKSEIEELKLKISEATKPFISEATKIEALGKLMLKPHFDQVETVKANKARALEPLRGEYKKSLQELDKTLDESTDKK